MEGRMIDLLRKCPFSIPVLAGMLALALVLGILNNLRVDEEKRVHWFGGPVVAASDADEGET